MQVRPLLSAPETKNEPGGFVFLFVLVTVQGANLFDTLSSAPNKNESYDTIGIATFVLFFLSKLPVTQGFGAMWQKRIVSLSYPPALISMLFRGVLTPCSDAEIHNETFLKRIISL